MFLLLFSDKNDLYINVFFCILMFSFSIGGRKGPGKVVVLVQLDAGE